MRPRNKLSLPSTSRGGAVTGRIRLSLAALAVAVAFPAPQFHAAATVGSGALGERPRGLLNQLLAQLEPINLGTGETSLITNLDVSSVSSLDQLVGNNELYRLKGSRRAPEIIAQTGATDALALRYEHIPPRLAPGLSPLPSLGSADHYMLAFSSSDDAAEILVKLSEYYSSEGVTLRFADIRSRAGAIIGQLGAGADLPNRRGVYAWTNGPLLFFSDGDDTAANSLLSLPYGVFEFTRTGPASGLVNGRECPPPRDETGLLREAGRSLSSEVSLGAVRGELQGWLQLCSRAGF